MEGVRMQDILPKNEGRADRTIRILVGAGLISLFFSGPQTTLGLIGVVPLITGLAGRCPLYRLLGIRTCPARRN
jgi:hypothetical protein